MRNLLISLACVAVFATLTLGWLFDSVYEKYKGAEEQLTETELVEQSGHNLAAILDAAPDSAAIINSLPESNIYKVYIETLADAVMPSDLVQQLMRKEVVILETSNKQLFHFYLEGKDSILILESPKLRKTDTHTFEQYFLTLLFYVLLIALFLLWAYPLLKQLSSLRNAAK